VLIVSLGLAATAGATGRPALLAATETAVARLDTAKATQAPAPAPEAEKKGSNRSFFGTPKGIAATLLLAGLTGYAIHSRITSAVHSPAR
jgi:hypothetical protein